MGTKIPKTKMPLPVWRDLCVSIVAMSKARENGADGRTLECQWERIHGFLRALQVCDLITFHEWRRLADAAYYAWTGQERESCRT